MNRALCLTLIASGAWTTLRGDVPATDYFVIRTKRLKTILGPEGKVDELGEEVLRSESEANGSFRGRPYIDLKMKRVRFGFSYDAGDSMPNPFPTKGESPSPRFFFYVATDEEGKKPIRCEGHVLIGPKPSVDPKWEQGEYTVVFKTVNLKL